MAPDDWVFAVLNVCYLAAGFIPGGTTNTMNAPASFVINQNFSFAGNGSPSAVRAHAYAGANEALLNAMNNSQRIIQLMPGRR